MHWRRTSQVCRGSVCVLAGAGSSTISTEPAAEISPEPAVVAFELNLCHLALQSMHTYVSMPLGHLWWRKSATRGTVSNQYAT